MTDVLVTGATGFVGRHLVERLHADGHHVTAYVEPSDTASWPDPLEVHVVRGDINDAMTLTRASEGREIVYHLAALTERDGLLARREVQRVNVDGTRTMAMVATRVGTPRLVCTSSVSVFGHRPQPRGTLLDERSPVRPDTPYGRSKVAVEGFLLDAHTTNGLPVVIARPSSVSGPGADSWRGFVEAIARGGFRILGPGTNVHHLVDVDDVVDGLLGCASSPSAVGNVYLLAGAAPCTLSTIVDTIADATGGAKLRPAATWAPLGAYRALDQVVADLTGHRLPRADRTSLFHSSRAFSIDAARRDLGYAPSFDTTSTIRRLVQWLRPRAADSVTEAAT